MRSFLIIGAQKAGTTTLYRDLLGHPDIFLPAVKEPNALSTDDVLTRAGRAAYRKLFVRAKTGQICGEASTSYAMMPTYTGVPRRARAIWGDGLKIIYLVREPVARILSQHQHECGLGLVAGDINELVRTDGRFIDYSNYPMQLGPWLDHFPAKQIKVVQFERYITERARGVAEICEFLGVDGSAARVAEEKIYNRSSGKPVKVGAWARLLNSSIYRTTVKPALPAQVRDVLRSALLPRSKAQRQDIGTDAKMYVYEALGMRGVLELTYEQWIAPLL